MLERYIQGVQYRNPQMAYLMVVGRTKTEAYRNAKRVGTALKKELPKEAEWYAPRPKGFGDNGLYRYEVPVMAALCFEKAKAVIAGLVLKGSVSSGDNP
jgi:hypothetical protein